MATKITLTVSQDLSEKDQHSLRLLLKDAFHEFVTKRYPARVYVENRYVDLSPAEAQVKVTNVERRIALGRMMHDASFDMTIEPAGTLPAPVYTYYRTCPEQDLLAMSAALELLPASNFPGGQREGWTVNRVDGVLELRGPKTGRAVWNDEAAGWIWKEIAQ